MQRPLQLAQEEEWLELKLELLHRQHQHAHALSFFLLLGLS
jgi:hypothetical protein